MNKIQIDLGKVENNCFVIMPFSMTFQTEYEKIIHPALEEINIKCVRGDEIYTKQRIMDDIWVSLRKCRFVLAELTGKNPNVLYELGLAHAIGKPVIIITRNSEDVPFDLQAIRYLFYDVNDPFWGENLKVGIQNLAKKIIENPTIEKYLDDIVHVEESNYPKLAKISKPKKRKFADISGTWTGEFYDYAESKRRTVKVTLQLDQNNETITGICLINYKIGPTVTVVQQIMNGLLKNDTINIYGVNYTFLERGRESHYLLDTFTLKMSGDNKMIGEIFSDPESTSVEPHIEFVKI